MTVHDEHELAAVAQEAARAAAAELSTRFRQRTGPAGDSGAAGVRAKSGPTDLVSDADLAAESAIADVLAARRPDDAILAEEGGARGEGALRWVVDPLDGTINFLFGIPVFAVSIACEDGAGTLAGVVLDPIRDDCFAATRSGPPTLNNEPIRASARDELATAMVATGFSYDSALRARQAAVLARVLPRARDIRRAGAAALDLAWTACGRYDAYYERGLKAWDLAAGALIASRAGLVVRELPAAAEDPSGLVVAPPGLIDELHALVGEA
jgi:myo-inositol-1(or 4)-monophosphatase